jgi:hypothetical protein
LRTITQFDVTQESGPALASVLVRVEGNKVHGLQSSNLTGSAGPVRRELQVDGVAQGSTFTVPVAMESVNTVTPVHFIFDCQAQDGTDTWRRTQVAQVQPPPRVSSLHFGAQG